MDKETVYAVVTWGVVMLIIGLVLQYLFAIPFPWNYLGAVLILAILVLLYKLEILSR